MQSEFSVPDGPPAQGVQLIVAVQPAAVFAPLVTKAKAKQPLGCVDVKENGTTELKSPHNPLFHAGFPE